MPNIELVFKEPSKVPDEANETLSDEEKMNAARKLLQNMDGKSIHVAEPDGEVVEKRVK
jgi:hypothetical protein